MFVDDQMLAYFVVKSASFIQEVEKLGIRLSSPEIKVTNFEITPDWDQAGKNFRWNNGREGRSLLQWQRL